MNHQTKIRVFLLHLICLFALSTFVEAAGELDTTFSDDGIVSGTVGDGGSSTVRATAIQPDGKIVSVGTAGFGIPNICALTRHNVNGSLDNSFDGDGKTIVQIGAYSECYGVAIQTDVKIIIAG